MMQLDMSIVWLEVVLVSLISICTISFNIPITHQISNFGDPTGTNLSSELILFSSVFCPTMMCPIVGRMQFLTTFITEVSGALITLHVEAATDPFDPCKTCWARLSMIPNLKQGKVKTKESWQAGRQAGRAEAPLRRPPTLLQAANTNWPFLTKNECEWSAF